MAAAEYTYQDVAEHNTKKDVWVVIQDKVYDVTKFVDEHPGGEEVLLDVGGQDSTEAFEDVGHSDEARATLENLLVGILKRKPGDPASMASISTASSSGADSTSFGAGMYLLAVISTIIAYLTYQYLQK